jgi:hypothetical protein
MSIAAIFAVHGLGTPGHLHAEAYAELRISNWLSVLAGAFFVACSAVTLPEHADDWLRRNGGPVFGLVTLGLGAYIIVRHSGLAGVHSRKRPQSPARRLDDYLRAPRVWRLAILSSLPLRQAASQWAMVVALILLMEVQASSPGALLAIRLVGVPLPYGAAFLVLFGGWLLEGVRAGNLSVFAEGLSMRDAVAQLNRGQTQPIADLIDAIELKDVYTLGHVRRVAVYAFNIGKELKLSPMEQRSLVLAAQMHDVGKIGTPDRILTKPGALTADVFAST